MSDAIVRVEKVLATGNLDGLTEAERVDLYRTTCESLGLNPATRPLEYLRWQGRTVLYIRKEATDQLRRLHGVSLRVTESALHGDLYVVRIEARMGDRTDEDLGVVPIGRANNAEALANAMMRALSKAKRRVTLSIVGLGWMSQGEDEDEPTSVGTLTPVIAPVEVTPVEVTPVEVAPEKTAAEVAAEVSTREGRQRMQAAIEAWRTIAAQMGDDVSDLRANLRNLQAAGTLDIETVEHAVQEAQERQRMLTERAWSEA
jgi:hypothetical protein